MTNTRPVRSLALVLALATPLGLARAAGAEPGPGVAPETISDSTVAPDPSDDPRLHRTGTAERVVRQAGDVVFSRPIHLVRLVAGVAALPVALPVAAVFADWRDAVDFCVTGPFWMVFQRPLGE